MLDITAFVVVVCNQQYFSCSDLQEALWSCFAMLDVCQYYSRDYQNRSVRYSELA